MGVKGKSSRPIKYKFKNNSMKKGKSMRNIALNTSGE